MLGSSQYWIFKVHYFSSLDFIFNAFSSAFKRFHEQILNFQRSLFFQFGCWVQVYFIRFNNISRTNIEFLKFTIFPVRMLGSMHFQAFSYNFMKKYWIFNVHYFSSSDVGFKFISFAKIIFHEQILNFQSSIFF